MATGTGNLPYNTSTVSPFDVILAQTTNEHIANINALADGSGIGDGAIDTVALAPGAVEAGNIAYPLVATGAINIGTTGIKTVTGLNFRPAVVEIIGIFLLSSTVPRTSIGGFSDSDQWTALTSGNIVSNAGDRCLWVVNPSGGATQASAERNAINSDGFSINVTAAFPAAITTVRWIAKA